MKTSIFLYILFLFSSSNLYGDQSVIDFFDKHPLGDAYKKINIGVDKNITLYGQQLSTFEQLDGEGNRVSIGLYGHQRLGVFDQLYQSLKKDLNQKFGHSEEFIVPNFEDSTERTSKMLGWRNDKSVLLLSITTDPSFQSIDLRLCDFRFYKNELGADYGKFVLDALEKHAGKLSLDTSTDGNHNKMNVKEVVPLNGLDEEESSQLLSKKTSEELPNDPSSSDTSESNKGVEKLDTLSDENNILWFIGGGIALVFIAILLKQSIHAKKP